MIDGRDERDPTVRQEADVGLAETLGGAPRLATASVPAPLASEAPAARPSDPGEPTGPIDRPTRPLRPRRTSTELAAGGAERYRFGALLGEGGMGEVVLAYDEHIGRDVAVKRIRTEHPGAEELARFVREARVQGRLEHPAVVPVHDLATDADGKPFFVMKRLTGTTMNELLCRIRDREEPDEAAARRRMLRAFVDVCLALEFAHEGGIVHRDVKPANIMLGDFGEVYVLDWGVARAITEAADADEVGVAPSGQYDLRLASGDTRQGTVLGTPAYMAPEQLAGDRCGPAADVYSLGCILFEIASGSPLHPRTRAVGNSGAPVDARASARRPESPPELDAICERATAHDPVDRHRSARALGDAVQAFLDGDRDLAVRAQLARTHLADARAALGRGTGDADRRAAIQAAGRALALDPTAAEAAELVTHLMLQPPTEAPAEVEEELARLDHGTARTQGKIAALSMIGYLAFVPLMAWAGVRDWTMILAFTAAALAGGLQVWSLSRRTQISEAGIYVSACLNAVLIGIICRIVGPLVIAPALCLSTLVAYASHPRLGKIGVVAPIFIAAVAVPWLLEAVGVLSPTYRFERGELILSSSVIRFSPVAVQFAFAALLVILVAVVALLSRTMAVRQRDVARRLELQAWHLRQIVRTSANPEDR